MEEKVEERLRRIDKDDPSGKKAVLLGEIIDLIEAGPASQDTNFLHALGNRIYVFDLTEEQRTLFLGFFRWQLETALAVLHERQPIFGAETEEEIELAHEYFKSLAQEEAEKEQKAFMASKNLADAMLTGLGHLNDLEAFRLLADYPQAIRGLNDHGITAVIRAIAVLPSKKQKELLVIALESVSKEFLSQETQRVLFQVLYKSDKFLPELVSFLRKGQ